MPKSHLRSALLALLIPMLWNTGSAQVFNPPVVVSTPGNPFNVASGDLNGDGIDDIAVTYTGGAVAVISSGTGTFTPNTVSTSVANIGLGIAIANVDGTNSGDILRGGGSAGTDVILNSNGLGTAWAAPVTYGSPSNRVIRTGNLNGDAFPDFIAIYGSSMRTFMNNGDGTFAAGQTLTGAVERGADLGDIDGDGDLDIVATDISGGNLRAWKNRGGTNALALGTFDASANDVTGVTSPRGMALANFDGDAALEVVVTSYTFFTILDNNGSGDFSVASTSTAASNCEELLVGDFDTDGRTDIAYTPSGTTQGLRILLGNGDRTFDAPNIIATLENPQVGFAGDFNNDGSDDIAFANGSANNIKVFLQVGPDITPPTLSPVTMSTTGNPGYAKAGDTITVSFTSSETLLAAPTVTIAGGAASVSNTGNNYTATRAVVGGDIQGPAAFSISSFSDAAGNPGTTVTSLTSGSPVTIDTLAPDAAFSVPTLPPAATNQAAYTGVTLDFSEAVVAPVAGAFTTSGVTISNVQTASASSYTFTATLDAPDGAKSFSFPAAGTTDLAGNANTATSTVNVLFDTAAPTTGATAPALLVGTSVAITATPDAGTGSAISGSQLFVRTPGSGSFVDSTLVPAGNVFTYTAAASGLHEFYVISSDAAGNTESKSSADDSTVVNITPNGAVTLAVAADGTVTFPMESGLNVAIALTGVSTPGTVTVSRTEGDLAPAGYNGVLLIDQVIDIAAGGGLAFGSATVTTGYDPALLGSVAEGAITIAVRDNAGTVTETAATVNTGADTIEFTTTGFSTWYFGEASATVADWTLLED